jgi:ribosomal-protein-alanine N-acetyltransferase
MAAIITERLELHTLAPAVVAALARGDIAAAQAQETPYRLDERAYSLDPYVLRLRHAQLLADPREEDWLYRAATLRGAREIIGYVGFHSAPDAKGVVEIGYRTAERHRRRGFALEMARAVIGWAARQGVLRCLASVRPDNDASLATIARLGFVRIGEQIDEIDGLEWVHALDLGPAGVGGDAHAPHPERW